jgi:ubiquinone/menaquinone biosynthesis C-methylase UbiE
VITDFLRDRGFKLDEMYGPMGAAIYSAMTRDDHAEPSAILKMLGRNHKILELASGDGRVTLPLLARGHRVTALDNSAEMLRLLTKKVSGKDRMAARLTVQKADILRDPIPGDSFDATLIAASTITLFSCEQRINLMRRMREVTAVGGKVIVTQFSPMGEGRYDSLVLLPEIDTVASFSVEADPDQCMRDIVIIPHTFRGEAVSKVALTHSVAVLTPDEAIEEMRKAGFTDIHRHPVADSGPFGHTTIMEGKV